MGLILRIDHTHLAKIDLNLLVAFDALAAERSVTRAAARIGIGQPAMSHALARLRATFQDELFIRNADGMSPTPRATALVTPIRSILDAIQTALDRGPAFDPRAEQRTFVVGMPDGVEVALLPRLVGHLRAEAPGVVVRVRSSPRAQVLSDIDADVIHLAIGQFEDGRDHHKRRGLYTANYDCLYDRRQIDLEPPITLEQYIRYPHVLFGSLTPKPHGIVDDALAVVGLTRTITATTAHFIALPFLLRAAPLFATCTQPAAQIFAEQLGLTMSPVPVALPSFSVSMLWHSSYDADPAHRWLRTTIAKLAQPAQRAVA